MFLLSIGFQMYLIVTYINFNLKTGKKMRKNLKWFSLSVFPKFFANSIENWFAVLQIFEKKYLQKFQK